MKRLLLILLPFLFISCAGINGPERHVSIENKTDVTQNITLIINNKTQETFTIPAHDVIYTTIIGGYTIKELDFRYDYLYKDENNICIINSKLNIQTVINNLPVDIILLDTNVPEFKQTIPANTSIEIEVYNINHSYYIENQNKIGDINYIEVNNVKYYFEFKNKQNTIFVTNI